MFVFVAEFTVRLHDLRVRLVVLLLLDLLKNTKKKRLLTHTIHLARARAGVARKR